jgi:hypothetical protein
VCSAELASGPLTESIAARDVPVERRNTDVVAATLTSIEVHPAFGALAPRH